MIIGLTAVDTIRAIQSAIGKKTKETEFFLNTMYTINAPIKRINDIPVCKYSDVDVLALFNQVNRLCINGYEYGNAEF